MALPEEEYEVVLDSLNKMEDAIMGAESDHEEPASRSRSPPNTREYHEKRSYHREDRGREVEYRHHHHRDDYYGSGSGRYDEDRKDPYRRPRDHENTRDARSRSPVEERVVRYQDDDRDRHRSRSRERRPRSDDQEVGSSRVFVGNLSYKTSWQDLKDFMRQSGGDVTFAKVMENRSGLSKGCGVVEFSSARDAERAIRELDGAELMGRRLIVKEDNYPPHRPSSTSSSYGHRHQDSYNHHHQHQQYSHHQNEQNYQVFVGNLPYETDWRQLKDLFREVAGRDLVRADVFTAPDGRSKGCGMVVFESRRAGHRAIERYNGILYRGRKLEVREDRPPPSSSHGHRQHHRSRSRDRGSNEYAPRSRHDAY